jgi:hypothetical protein
MVTLRSIAAGSRAECCATCGRQSLCPLVNRKQDLTSSTCAVWDANGMAGPRRRLYLQLASPAPTPEGRRV